MCDSKGKWLSFLHGGLFGYMLNNQSYKKAKKQDAAAINAANQAAANQIEANKVANATQSTENTVSNTTDTKKLASQKVPLNTSSTGATLGSQTSVSLYFLTISLPLVMLLKIVEKLIRGCETLYLSLLGSQESWTLPYLQYLTLENLMAKSPMKKVEGFILMIYTVLRLFLNGLAMYLGWNATNRLRTWKNGIQQHLDALKTDIQVKLQDAQ